jgi:CO dehydrogenase maturation factor
MATIAVSGKGGSGKTTIAALIIKLLVERTGKAVLGVDGDPNACLGLTLGVEPERTIAELREQAAEKKPGNPSMDRVRTFEYGIQQAIKEAKGFDLITMGHPEGPGCYCAANNILRTFLDKLSSQYEHIVMDNEAGMEHLSRRTTNKVDLLCIIAEPTAVGKLTAKRIFDLTKRLPIIIGDLGVIWNKADAPCELDGLNVLGAIPLDQSITDAAIEGRTILDIDSQSPAVAAIEKMLENQLSSLKTHSATESA